MREYRNLLTSFVEVVTFLLAAFGGFLKNIAPPAQTGAQYAVGILSFLLLIALLIISSIARAAHGRKYRRNWIIAGAAGFLIAVPPAFLYPRVLATYTWSYPPEKPIERVRGLDSDFTAQVKAFIKDNPDQMAPEQLARNFDVNDIWTPESLGRASTKLLAVYLWLVMSFATAIFCLLEANAGAIRRPTPAATTPKSESSASAASP